MSTPSYREDNVSQMPALQLLINMGYSYVSPKQAEKWLDAAIINWAKARKVNGLSFKEPLKTILLTLGKWSN